MPAKLKVRVVAGRNLPVMDRASDLTDAFVEVKFSSSTFKTDVYRKSLNPQWKSEWYRFEVDDEELQNEPLQIRVLDHDTYSAHDSIGKVYIDLNPLLSRDGPQLISGWFPIYDTMHGIRGEINVIVKVELFSDFNRFRQSSCGVQFFCTSGVPQGYQLQAIHGFVEELVVNDDPEHQWIDKIRSMRASNEARQTQFSKLSGVVQRKIGLKILELGGNAVIGYRQCFDLEGESGIVVRGIGTAVSICRRGMSLSPPHSASPGRDTSLSNTPATRDTPTSTPTTRKKHVSAPHVSSLYVPRPAPPAIHPHSLPKHCMNVPASAVMHAVSPPVLAAPRSAAPRLRSFPAYSMPLPMDAMLPQSPQPVTPTRLSSSPTKPSANLGFPVAPRRLSDSDLGTPPKGSSLTGSSSSGGGSAGTKPTAHHRTIPHQHSIEMLEFPFFTMTSFPIGFLMHLGGVVSARSVKLLDRIHNPDEPETRDAWWTEIRTEIRSHARAMGCHVVVGYSEHTTIYDEIIVLSAYGTASRINISGMGGPTSLTTTQPPPPPQPATVSLDRFAFEKEKEKERHNLHVDVNLANQTAAHRLNQSCDGLVAGDIFVPQCSLCHIPYSDASLPFPTNLAKCAMCGRYKVPDILFATIDLPPELRIIGKGCLVQARICRPKKDTKGETNAKEISDCLPFLEIDLHRQLLSKLKVKGMNSLFGLKMQVVVGEKMIVGLATGTAVFLAPMVPPQAPKILGKGDKSMMDSSILNMQRKIISAVSRNRDLYGIHIPENLSSEVSPQCQLTDDEDEVISDLELSSGSKETFVLEIDDAEDAQVVSVLLDPNPPDGFDTCTTERMPGVPNLACNLQMFSKMWRGELNTCNNIAFSNRINYILKGLFFKLRSMAPCCLTHIEFDIDLPEEDVIQICITGLVAGIGEPPSLSNGLVNIASETQSTDKEEPLNTSQEESMMFHMEIAPDAGPVKAITSATSLNKGSNLKLSGQERKLQYYSGPLHKESIELTPLGYVPLGKIDHYMGHLNFFIIRETTSAREEGGLNGFMQSFLAEVLAICRAHVASLGGNALVAYRMTECVLEDNMHKNQSQCLVNVYGDVVHVAYDTDTQPMCTPPSRSSGHGTDSAGSGMTGAVFDGKASGVKSCSVVTSQGVTQATDTGAAAMFDGKSNVTKSCTAMMMQGPGRGAGTGGISPAVQEVAAKDNAQQSPHTPRKDPMS